MNKDGNVCKQWEESTSQIKTFYADQRALLLGQCSGHCCVRCTNILLHKHPAPQRSQRSGRTARPEPPPAAQPAAWQERCHMSPTTPSSCCPAGKQAQNPKEKQTRGKNLAQDQWQQRAARFVCKWARVGKNQLADFINIPFL